MQASAYWSNKRKASASSLSRSFRLFPAEAKPFANSCHKAGADFTRAADTSPGHNLPEKMPEKMP